jgi:hypothetical protein
MYESCTAVGYLHDSPATSHTSARLGIDSTSTSDDDALALNDTKRTREMNVMSPILVSVVRPVEADGNFPCLGFPPSTAG